MAVLRKPTYVDIARNLDIAITNCIRASRELPAKWKDNALLTKAHGLYWEEHDAELQAAARVFQHHRKCGMAAIRE